MTARHTETKHAGMVSESRAVDHMDRAVVMRMVKKIT